VIVLDDEEPAPLAINVADQWDPSAATTLSRPRGFSPSIELKDQAYRARNAYDAKEALQTGKRKIRKEDVKKAGEEMLERGREAVTAKMVGIIYERIVHGYKEAERKMSTLGKDSNPITNSDLYTRTDHFVSAATGHQVSNRGGGSSGAATYWSVRTAKMEEQAREKVCLCLSGHGPGHREYTFGGVSPRCYSYRRGQKSDLLKGLLFYINGSTGPRVSNLQVQHLITSHGGRFVYVSLIRSSST
jgi:hypothetical protein